MLRCQTEAFKLSMFCNGGLHPHVRATLLQVKPTTLAAAITKAIVAERFVRSMVESSWEHASGHEHGQMINRATCNLR